VLNPNRGQIHVALCEGQGGATATTAEEWKQSWTAAQYAAEHGLLLVDVETYEVSLTAFESLKELHYSHALLCQPVYDLSSHRGVDRPFRIGSSPELHRFTFPNGKPVDQSLQLCCRHELHLVMPKDSSDGNFSRKGLVDGDEVLQFVRNLVPSSIRVEVPIRQVLPSSETDVGGQEMVVFLIIYCGERKQLTRSEADAYRDKLETEISKHMQLRDNRRGRLVSRPFPYPLLQELIDKHTGD